MKKQRNSKVNKEKTESLLDIRSVEQDNLIPDKLTVGEFKQQFSDNSTVPLIYSGKGLVPIDSPYNTLVTEKASIIDSDTIIIGKLNSENKGDQKDDFIYERRMYVQRMVRDRMVHMSRSVAFNFDNIIGQSINNCINEMRGNEEDADNRFTNNLLSFEWSGLRTDITSLSKIIYDTIVTAIPDLFSTPENNNRDTRCDSMITSYNQVSSVILQAVIGIYNMYDIRIMELLKGYLKGEELYINIMQDISQHFETLKPKLHWLDTSIRFEIDTIYKPMMMSEYSLEDDTDPLIKSINKLENFRKEGHSLVVYPEDMNNDPDNVTVRPKFQEGLTNLLDAMDDMIIDMSYNINKPR